tara:strand:+ start:169 stop:312 length:144 start_codon:yes stop_codon:yes gene_type:complete
MKDRDKNAGFSRKNPNDLSGIRANPDQAAREIRAICELTPEAREKPE